MRGKQPPLFHVTHAKAGSTWLYRTFNCAFPGRVAKRLGANVGEIDARPGDIHSAIFCSYETYKSIRGAQDAKCFYVMRDIRDALVSLYFSLRYSHRENEEVKVWRTKLQAISEDEGLMYIFQTRSEVVMHYQSSWLESGMPIYRYEDLFASNGEMLFEILNDLDFDYDADKLKAAIEEQSFEKQFNRKPGETDNYSHGRRGLPGGWKDHLTPQLEKFISDNLAQHLKLAGYES